MSGDRQVRTEEELQRDRQELEALGFDFEFNAVRLVLAGPEGERIEQDLLQGIDEQHAQEGTP